MKYSITEIAEVLNIDEMQLCDTEAVVSQLLTDSRSLTYAPETLFFALRTSNDDGHHYVADLYEQGVRNFVVDSMAEIPTGLTDMANFLLVDNTLDALQTLATYHRRRFNIPVIGITGSRGKTTVKEWLYQLLKDDYHIVRSPRSYNSQIGVPLSLWDLDEHTTLAIIEAGISTTGEMERLQAMIRPTIGVITNIGTEHDEGFASMTEKAQEKAKILNSCEQIVYSADDPLVTTTIAPLLEVDVAQETSWSTRGRKAALQILETKRTDKVTTISYSYHGVVHQATVPFDTDRDVENAIICLAVMLLLNLHPACIAARMKLLTPVGTRINVIEGVNECTVIVDGYNSDYASLTPALNFMMRRAGSRNNTVVLSDLKPDAYSGDELYIRVSELLRGKGVHRLLGVGQDLCQYAHYFDSLPSCRFFATTDDLLAAMAQGDFDHETILVKGSPDSGFDQVVDLLEAKRHQTVMEVNLNALAHNFRFFKSLVRSTTKTVAMVKASGYGTGSYEIAKTLQDRGADYLAVAVQDEGVELRRAGILMPIIVLNPSVVNYKAMFVHRLEPEVYSLEECRELVQEGRRCGVRNFPVHVKIDSGMHRLGFTHEQLPALIDLLHSQDVLHPVSVFSHLCVAEEAEQDDYTRQQCHYFGQCATLLQEAFQHHILRHILNTSGIVRFPEYQFDMVRIGIGMYGIRTVPGDAEATLQPVASLHAVIIAIQQWPAGTTVGYGRKGVLTRDSRIATVSIGYADGMDRHFGKGNTSVWVGGKQCPTVGNVCMDALMVDVTEANCQVGDTVEIFGEHISIEQLAEVRGTIPYEILTSISPRVKRVYYRE
ncbi:MAG: bifunctional UDP-N-acetylmuramoyl-tripeptide:D-alanyl-D-alanine ligase/alanine racemase [Muribaculaceae bacterium]|nr:bifunctional UDP-N-acetylmuramoyl-tripeptide:D-alanyl-D-alanine ligase/alanine racemase [Muribaculaceae bacterium]